MAGGAGAAMGGAAAGAIPGATGAAGAVGGAAGGASGFCANLAACCAKLKAALCGSPFGQMLNSGITGPLNSIGGGFFPALCPPPTAAQAAAIAAAQGSNSAAATAAAIQASEAGAAARVAAIEYLGTVDCTRWPEAKTALISGLRADTNECVRFAAARALNSGCCCNKDIIAALRICVAGEDTDGNPVETSLRVKAAAFTALQHCLMCVPEDVPQETLPPPEGEKPRQLTPLPESERRTQQNAANPHMAAAYNPLRPAPTTPAERLRRKTFAQTVQEARRTLIQASQTPRQVTAIPSGQRSLFGALSRARHDLDTANVRKAREQGVLPPRPDQYPASNLAEPGHYSPADPGVQPSSYAPSSVGAGTAPLPEGMSADPGAMSNVEETQAPASGARRGLIGALFRPRGE